MDVADDALKPAPPERMVVAVLVVVRFLLAPALAFGRVVLVAGRALPYLVFAIAWVLSAICAATVLAHLAWGESSAPFVFLVALMEVAAKVCVILLLLALAAMLCGLCLVYLIAAVSGSGSELNKSACGAITCDWESTQELLKLPRAVVLGLVADLAFILLIVAGISGSGDVVACRGISISGRNHWFRDRGCGVIWPPCDILLRYHSSFSTGYLEG